MKKIVLASQSPRRKELLLKCVQDFVCDPADIDESIDSQLPLTEALKELACQKAKTVLSRHPDAIVIGSDTTVTLDGVVLGKPEDEKDAYRMLKMLEGKSHQVMTALAIVSEKRVYRSISVVDVTFAKMSDEEIMEYIATGECGDKAGAYAIQGYGSRYIRGIAGDYFSVVGLPVHEIYEEMKNIALY